MRRAKGRADPGTRPESPPGGAAVAARGAWYVDPFGTAGERWWDGHKWTRETRGAPTGSNAPKRWPQEPAPGADKATEGVRHRQIMMPGWYPWDAKTVRFWDGGAWQQTRGRTAEEQRPDEPKPPRWMVRAGYLAAVLLPILGLVLGLMVAVRPENGARAKGIRIIILSAVVFAAAVLLSHR